MSAVSTTMPIPSGAFMPVFVLGTTYHLISFLFFSCHFIPFLPFPHHFRVTAHPVLFQSHKKLPRGYMTIEVQYNYSTGNRLRTLEDKENYNTRGAHVPQRCDQGRKNDNANPTIGTYEYMYCIRTGWIIVRITKLLYCIQSQALKLCLGFFCYLLHLQFSCPTLLFSLFSECVFELIYSCEGLTHPNVVKCLSVRKGFACVSLFISFKWNLFKYLHLQAKNEGVQVSFSLCSLLHHGSHPV